MTDAMSQEQHILHAAHIDVELQLEQLQLWLPVDRPILIGRGGLLSAMAMLAALALVIVAASPMNAWFSLAATDGHQILIITVAVIAMLSIAFLVARDVVERLVERLVDRVRPLRGRREKLSLTQHMVITEREALGLDTIQSVSIKRRRHTTTLSAHTAQGVVPIAQHRSMVVMETLGVVIEKHAARYRQTLREQGEDPDHPAQVPQPLQNLRNPSA
jgi:hypothetical protein